MTHRLSKPIDALIDGCLPEPGAYGLPEGLQEAQTGDAAPCAEADVVVVGSGYGGAVAAARLAGAGREVIVLERGREYAPGDFPEDMGELPRHVRFQREGDEDPIGYADGLFDFRIGAHMDVLVGNGLGGTSLINASVAARPGDEVFRLAAWPPEIRDDPSSLHPYFQQVETLLGITPCRPATKTEGLRKLALQLNASCDPAPVAVTFSSPGGPQGNSAGIAQPPCTECGNCVTGCNVGAKNTLAMNALPLAAARGAKLYTGATVVSVMPNAGAGASRFPWIVRLRRTAAEKTPLAHEVFHVAARDVILAAGTLGSTEILLRSHDPAKLPLSGMLGRRFSGNGDAIAVGYAQASRIDGIGKYPQAGGPHGVGPTITGLCRTRITGSDGVERPLTIEEGAVPAALAGLFGEIVTTASLFQRLDDSELPAWHQASSLAAADPIRVPKGSLEHTQVLLMMGDDGAQGRLRLRTSPSPATTGARSDRGHVVVDWPDIHANEGLRSADHRLAAEDRKEGFDRGQYLPNPLWRLVPESAEGILGGAAPGGRATTVHPLGGCPMGDCAETGVVDHLGRVFSAAHDASAGTVHHGLHVLDGAIIPAPLGINPFLTIAALSWRAADDLLQRRGWAPSSLSEASPAFVPEFPSGTAVPPPPSAPLLSLELREQLMGRLDAIPDWLRRLRPAGDQESIDRLAQRQGFVLHVRMDIEDLDGFLEGSTGYAIPATAEIRHHPLPADVVENTQLFSVGAHHWMGGETIASGSGSVRLFEPDDVFAPVRVWRTLRALCAFFQRRVGPGRFASDGLFRLLEGWRHPSVPGRRRERPGPVKLLKAIWHLAWQHALHRRMTYAFTFECPDRQGPGTLTLRLAGEKRLAWTPGAPRLWDALLVLPVTLAADGRGGRASARLDVDSNYMFGEGAPQAKTAPHLPAVVEGVARLGMQFLRAMAQTHFWEFGAPDYPEAPVDRPPGSPPLRAGGEPVQPEVVDLAVPALGQPRKIGLPLPLGMLPSWVDVFDTASRTQLRPRDGQSVPLRLTRYRQPKADALPVLLVHGLAQGSLIFTTGSLETNMAAAMWKAGFDVWVVDYRLSSALPGAREVRGWSMEEMAGFDMPAAIEHVHHATGGKPVSVFAHCVGATAMAMGILAGWIDGRQLRCVAFNAIHPWIMPSEVNRFRALLGTFFRDLLADYPLDPLPSPSPSAIETVVDRVAFSFARYAEGEDPHCRTRRHDLAEAVCDRMSFFYGRMWEHENLDKRTHLDFPLLVGVAPGDVYRHLYYLVSRQRVTDREGMNTFLRTANLQARWRLPTLFLHGNRSLVFNPQSATRSAVRLGTIVNDPAQPNPPSKPVPVGVCRFDDLGHMDVVFSEKAREDAFPTLACFFTDPAGAKSLGPWHPDDDVHSREDQLTTGPILRAAWVEEGKVNLRLWAETDDGVTATVNGLSLQGQGVSPAGNTFHPGGWEVRYCLQDAHVAPTGDISYSVRAKLPAAPAVAPYLPPATTPPWLGHVREALGGTPCRDMRFLVGSCRYPGTPFDRDLADAVFAGMRPHVDGAEGHAGVHQLFLLGDQIYADATAGILDTKAWRERFHLRYREAFTSRHLRKVLGRVPTHFAIDDHEFRDNWSGDFIETPEWKNARLAAHSFLSSGRDTNPLPGARGAALWYPLSDGHEHCCPAFVMDTRSERTPRALRVAGSGRLVSPEQMKALKDWLSEAHTRRPEMPKFIFCGVGIGPIARDFAGFPQTWRAQDGWLGHPHALEEVCRHILDGRIGRVVFVSGDLHLSALSRLTIGDGTRTAIVWNLVSSGLYSPMPFANAHPAEYEWNEPVRVAVPGTAITVVAESGLLCSGPPHFVRVDAERAAGGWVVGVTVVGADGRAIAPQGRTVSDATAAAGGWSFRP